MGETPSEKPSEPKGSDPVGQDDIDALLNDLASESAADAPKPDTVDAAPASENGALLSQADIDAALAGGGDAPAVDTAGAPKADAVDAAPASENGALFSQADIDAALAGGGDAPAVDTADVPKADTVDAAPASGNGAVFSQADIDAALGVSGDSSGGGVAEPVAAAAPVAPQPTLPPREPLPNAAPLQLKEIGSGADASELNQRVSMLKDVNLRVRIELGRTRMLVEDVLKLGDGSVVELEKLAGDPVDVLVNDRLIARGEVLVLNDTFCVRINEVLTEDPHRVCV